MIFSLLLCWVPFLLIAPLCLLEYLGLRALRTRMGYDGFAYLMASLVVYLAPIGFLILTGLLVSWIFIDGSWVWLGESSALDPRTEWSANIFFLLMATWPIWLGYLGIGFVVWVLSLRDEMKSRDSSGELLTQIPNSPGI